jgi:ATP phosphoribosyltransferase
MTQITLALTKGRILKETLPLLANAGIEPAEDIFTSRKLVFATNHDGLRLLILRGSDVPTYVQFGAADLGVAGKDGLLEHQGDGYYEPLDLGIARCKLMTAGPCGRQTPAGSSARSDKVYQCSPAVLCAAGPTGRPD